MLRQLSVTLTLVDGNDDPEHARPARLGGARAPRRHARDPHRPRAHPPDRGEADRRAAAPDTPIAAISAASRAAQQVLRGTLAALPAPLPPPVTFVDRRRRRARPDRAAPRREPHAHPRRLPDRRGRRARRRGGRRAGLAVCLRGAARTVRERDLPVAGLAARVLPRRRRADGADHVGTQGHLLGGALAVALLGPVARGGLDDRGRVRDPGARARRRRDHDARA